MSPALEAKKNELAKRILLVEDDASLGETMHERLLKEGYDCRWERTAASALQAVRETSKEGKDFDILVLDVGLPDGSGFELAEKLKKETAAPFLFVTAQTSAEDRLQGYELGAEEYIPKPFHLKEFLLRVRHVIENHVRELAKLPKKIVSGREIDFESRTVRGSDGKIEFLAAKDFECLKLLVTKSPRVLSRDEILNEVWGESEFPSTRTIDNAVVRLRQAIGDRDGEIIRSVRGVGYQWVDPENGSPSEPEMKN